MLDPQSTFILMWDKLLVILIIFVFILYSYIACFPSFDDGQTAYETDSGKRLLIFTYLFDLFLAFDIVIQLRTAIPTANGLY